MCYSKYWMNTNVFPVLRRLRTGKTSTYLGRYMVFVCQAYYWYQVPLLILGKILGTCLTGLTAIEKKKNPSLTCWATCCRHPGCLAGCCAAECGATGWQRVWRWPAAAGGWSSGSSPAGWHWAESRHQWAPGPTSWGRSENGSPQPSWSHPPGEEHESEEYLRRLDNTWQLENQLDKFLWHRGRTEL